MQSRPPFDLAADRVIRALVLFGVMPAMVVAVVVAVLVAPLVGLLALFVVAGAWAALVQWRARGAMDRVLARSAARHGPPPAAIPGGRTWSTVCA